MKPRAGGDVSASSTLNVSLRRGRELYETQITDDSCQDDRLNFSPKLPVLDEDELRVPSEGSQVITTTSVPFHDGHSC